MSELRRTERAVEGLTPADCRSRQVRFAQRLRTMGLDAALLFDRRHAYYFTGHWGASYLPTIAVIGAEGEAKLVVAEETLDASIAADKVIRYQWQRMGTLLEDLWAEAWNAARHETPASKQIGADSPAAFMPGGIAAHSLQSELLEMRRAKDADEVALVSHAIRGCEAAYARAAELLEPGVREIDLFAEMQAAAVKEVGELIGEMGNDFQAGSGGGPPRLRAVEAGELMPLDVAVSVRGYRCDLCRTFVVGGEPTVDQREAAKLAVAALDFVESHAKPGTSARWLDSQVRTLLDNDRGWQFPHHLGHGIGLGVHEAPRLNPHWDDVLTPGDLFTVEPGLYHSDLRAGVRIEENYWMTPSGLERLSAYPRDLITSHPKS